MSFFASDIYGDYTHGTITLGEFKRQMGESYNDENAGIKVPDYQRNFVWTAPLKQRYLDTLSKRGPVFGFVMNYRSSDGVYELIDGQNRGKTIFEFMNDDLVYNRSPEEGGALKYSDIEGSDKRLFDRMEIHFIKSLNWDEDECQEYFRTIQDGMKLTKGEEIHSAQNNIYQNKIVHLATKYEDILKRPKKEGGFHYTNRRFIHYEIIGGLLKIIMDNHYLDRPGQVALKEMKKWDNFPQGTDLSQVEIEQLANLDEAVQTFEQVMKHYIILREASDNLSNMTYSRDATFIRSMYFIFMNDLHILDPGNGPSQEIILRFDEMMGIILSKNTTLHDYITLCGTKGKMEQIMGEYKRVYDNPLSQFVLPVNTGIVSDTDSDESSE